MPWSGIGSTCIVLVNVQLGICAEAHTVSSAEAVSLRLLSLQRGTRSLGILAAFIWHSVSDERK